MKIINNGFIKNIFRVWCTLLEISNSVLFKDVVDSNVESEEIDTCYCDTAVLNISCSDSIINVLGKINSNEYFSKISFTDLSSLTVKTEISNSGIYVIDLNGVNSLKIYISSISGKINASISIYRGDYKWFI